MFCSDSVSWLYRAEQSFVFLGASSPVTRRQADACFLRLMSEFDFALRWVYWAAVRVFGRLVWHAKRARRNWRGTGVPVGALLASGKRPTRAP